MADARAETDDALLPILAARQGAVQDVADRAFPDLEKFSTSVTDDEGWFAGTLFGDRADVGIGAVLDERAAS
jgi:hypothetical protein